MKRLALALFVTMAFAVSAMADSKIACEGILEHGSGGEYISLPKMNQHVGLVQTSLMQCWLFANMAKTAKLRVLLPLLKKIQILIDARKSPG
jgi:hypothetical protein